MTRPGPSRTQSTVEHRPQLDPCLTRKEELACLQAAGTGAFEVERSP